MPRNHRNHFAMSGTRASMAVSAKWASGNDIEESGFLTTSAIIVRVPSIFGVEMLSRLQLWHEGCSEVSCASILEADVDFTGLSENVDCERFILIGSFWEGAEFIDSGGLPTGGFVELFISLRTLLGGLVFLNPCWPSRSGFYDEEGNNISWSTEAVPSATCGSARALKRFRKRVPERNFGCSQFPMTSVLAASRVHFMFS